MGIEIIGKLTQKNNGDFKLVDLADVDYDGTGKSAKQELEKKIEEAKNSQTPYDDTKIKTDINNIKTDLGTEELTTTSKKLKGAINELGSQIKYIENNGTTTEVVENKVVSVINEKIADGSLSQVEAVIEDGSISISKTDFIEVKKSKYCLKDYVVATSNNLTTIIIDNLDKGSYNIDFYALNIKIYDNVGSVVSTQWNGVQGYVFACPQNSKIEFKVYTDSANSNYVDINTNYVINSSINEDILNFATKINIDSIYGKIKNDNIEESYVNNIINRENNIIYNVNRAIKECNIANTIKTYKIISNKTTNYMSLDMKITDLQGTILINIDNATFSNANFNGVLFAMGKTNKTNILQETFKKYNISLITDSNYFYESQGSYFNLTILSYEEYTSFLIHYNLNSYITSIKDTNIQHNALILRLQIFLKNDYSLESNITNIVASEKENLILYNKLYKASEIGSIYEYGRMATFGDSITWYNGKVNTEDAEVSTFVKGYQYYISKFLGVSIDNFGVSGQTMTGEGCDKILNLEEYDYDLITIAYGTNDFKLNKPVGTIDDVENTTFYGAYKKSIEHILNINPTAKIMLITPLQRDNSGYSITSTNSVGCKLNDYRQAILNLSELYSLPVYDAYKYSGITIRNLDVTTLDGLHPNNTGYEKYGKSISNFINSI